MSLSICVQARPERADNIELLVEQTGAEVVWDPEPENPARSPWRTYRRCWETAPPGSTHRLILQDDVDLCPGFLEAATTVTGLYPDDAICFFVQGCYPYMARVEWACSLDRPIVDLEPDRWVPAVATSWPTWAIPELLNLVDLNGWNDIRADDEVIGRAARTMGLRVLATCPSLVEHWDRRESVGGKRRAMDGADIQRVAACFIHESDDARRIPWGVAPPARMSTYGL